MKRKKHDRLPNGYGEIRYLGPRRKNCYAVHPPATKRNEHGEYIKPKPLCYVDDWYTGFAVLNAYHAGTYKPGDEMAFKSYKNTSSGDLDALCDRIISDYYLNIRTEQKTQEKTFTQVYELFYEYKFGEHAPRKLSPQTKESTHAAYLNLSSLHNKIFRNITLEELQACLDSCKLKRGSMEQIKSLLLQMYKFAEPRNFCDKNYAQYLRIPDTEEGTHGQPFTDADLEILWENKNIPIVELLLIMCYSGFRITAYTNIEVHLKEGYFRGGIKTAAGKNRIVPIHSAIAPLVKTRLDRDGGIIVTCTDTVRYEMGCILKKLGIKRHTPHDCRHTFSRLCEKYGVREADRKRMMGHSFGADITNGVYGHRTVEELRAEIEKIETPL